MSSAQHSEPDPEALAKRRVPCLIGFLHPFRIVTSQAISPWNVTIEDVNRRGWDYAELHRIMGGIDVGLDSPYHMVVSRDGGVGIPPLKELRHDQTAVEFLNRSFAALLLGGVYCEAISLDGLDFGSIIDWTYLRAHSNASANRFHHLARLQAASSLEAIHLMSARSVTIEELSEAMLAGRGILDALPELTGEFVLKGTTGFARRDWGAALSNLWIVVEQITSNLWERRILAPARSSERIAGRLDQLSDTRTWTVATRHELLLQLGVLTTDVMHNLSVARRARNALAHTGRHPSEADAKAAYQAMLSILELATGGTAIPLQKLDLENHTLSDPFAPRDVEAIDPTYWIEIPKLPGELELERLEASQKYPLREIDI